MYEYTKKVVDHYTQHRDNYRSTDKIVFPLLQKLGIRNKEILDFGCGHGVDSMKFIKMGAKRVVGTDISKAMVDLAKKQNHHKSIKYIRTDGKPLPLKDSEFDLVFANFVVHYLANTKKHFKEIVRVLKSGGYFLAVFNCLTTDSSLLNKRVPMLLGKGAQQTRIHIVSKSPQEIKNSLKFAGLKVVKFSRVANPDAKIDPTYENKYGFKKFPVILIAKKI